MQRNYFILVVTIILTGVMALSAHTIILNYLTPPVVKLGLYSTQVTDLLIRFLTAASAIFIYLCSKEYWIRFKLPYQVILFALLILALTEQLVRVPMMGIVIGVSWTYQLLLTIPIYLGYLTLSTVTVLFIPILLREKRFGLLKYIVLAILACALIFLVRKITQAALAPLLDLVSQGDVSKFALPPYGMSILIPAYLTFIEPTIASFILLYLIYDKLKAFSTLAKGLIMGGIFIAIHGGIQSILLILSSEGNIFYRLFYYGQFLWEYLLLGILTAYSYDCFWKK